MSYITEEWRKGELQHIDAYPYPDRIFTVLSLVFAIGAAIFSAFRPAGAIPAWAIAPRDVCIFLTMLILVLFFYGRYRIILGAKQQMRMSLEQQLKAFGELIGKQIEIYYDLMNRTRESIFHGAGQFYPRRFIYGSNGLQKLLNDSLDNVISSIHDILMNHLKTRFPGITDEIALSIKAVVTGGIAKQLCDINDQTRQAINDSDEYVVTLARDQMARTKQRREVKQKLYSIANNTAFRTILWGADALFFSNDLKHLADEGLYQNEQMQWRDTYNATLVVPIWHLPKGQESLRFGLFTVDSKNTGRYEMFNHKETKLIMSFGADLLALVFLNLELFDSLSAPQHQGT